MTVTTRQNTTPNPRRGTSRWTSRW